MAEAGRENVDASNVLEFESSGELNPIIARLISNGIPIGKFFNESSLLSKKNAGLDGIDNPLIYTLSEASTVGSEFLPSLRKRYMSNQLQKHQECFTSFTPYDLWIGSWNVAGIEGENFEALRPWMDFESLHNSESDHKLFNIYH